MRLSSPRWYLSVGAVLAVTAGVVSPSDGDGILLAVIAASVVAVAAGIRAYRPAHVRLWLLLAATFICWGVAASLGTSQLVSIEFLPAYAFLFAAGWGLLRASGQVPLGRADATVALLALTAVVWPLALQPNIEHLGSAGHLGGACTVVADIVVLTFMLRLAFTPTARLPAFRLVIAGMALTIVADVVNSSPVLAGLVAHHVVHFLYALAFVFGGAAALSPSMRDIPVPATRALDPSPRRSIAVLSAALVAPFAGAALNEYFAHDSNLSVFLVFGAVVAVVAIAKMSLLFRRLDALRSAAEASEQRFRMVFDSAGVGISLGRNGMLTETNKAYQRMLDYSGEELARMHYAQITHPDDVHLDEEAVAQVAAGKRSTFTLEKRYLRRDGSTFWVKVTVTTASDGTFDIGIIEDISERKQLEEERRALLARTVEVAEAERMALAADLHDGPIQHLTAVTLTLDLLANKLMRGELTGAAHLAQQLRESIASEMQSLRRLMGELRPPILDERGLDAALYDCAGALLDDTPVRAVFDSRLNGHWMAPELETAIYRVVREALTNVRKHAGASEVRITLAPREANVELTIADDGVGFTPAAGNGDHVGVLTMRERIESVGGTWVLESAPGRGTVIRASMPGRLR